jgi:tetratricopeptide (TPR) repeat protein
VLLGRAFGWLGEIYLLAGRPADARAAATRGRETAEQHGYRYERALCERVLGEVATAQGDWADAERLLGASVAEFERLEAEPELARAEAAQGRLARARGAPDEAAAAFARAAERFERCGMAWDLERVRQALRSGATR